MELRPKVGVSLIIRKGDQVLIQKRIGKHCHGQIGFPGGHLEMFENFEDAALRELAEEAGDIQVTTPKLLTCSNTKFFYENKHYVVVFMVCDWVGGEAEVTEPEKCEYWIWCKWDDLLKMPIMKGIIDLIDREVNPFDVEL